MWSMPIEFIGYVGTCHESEIHARQGPIVDVSYTRALAREHERAGFDRVLIGYFSHAPDGFVVSADIAVEIAAKHADVYALWGEPLADAKAHIERVRAAAAARGRTPGISLSIRPIVAPTEDEAWDRAYRILDTINARVSSGS